MSKDIELIVEGFTRIKGIVGRWRICGCTDSALLSISSPSGGSNVAGQSRIDDDIEVIESGLRSLGELAAAIAKEL